ncbi:MAG: hypothetical protein HY781_13115 [Chloroflexi bacterium]|nr:hypothetical protein [Chloroflexota bacterium]
MDIVVCPKCKMRVIPKADGTCPSCQGRIRGAAKTYFSLEGVGEAKKQRPEVIGAASSRQIKRELHYWNVLKRAWKFFWQFKILWLFFIIPVCFYSLFSSGYFLLSMNPVSSTGGAARSLYLLIALMLVTVLYLAGWFLGTAAYIEGIFQADKGQEKLSFSSQLKKGLSFFGKIFGANLLISVGFIAVLALLLVLVIFMGDLALLCIIPFVLAFLPAMIIVQCLMEQSQAAIVVDKLGILAGLQRGWEVLKNNFWKVILMFLILNGGAYVISMVISMPLYFAWLPVTSNLVNGDIQSLETALASMKTVFAIILPIYMIINSIVLILCARCLDTYISPPYSACSG